MWSLLILLFHHYCLGFYLVNSGQSLILTVSLLTVSSYYFRYRLLNTPVYCLLVPWCFVCDKSIPRYAKFCFTLLFHMVCTFIYNIPLPIKVTVRLARLDFRSEWWIILTIRICARLQIGILLGCYIPHISVNFLVTPIACHEYCGR